jgi:hypothetical protein
VVLVNAKSKAKPVKAQALAQHNLDGGGNTDADRRAKSPMPLLRVEQLEQEVHRQLLVQQKSKITTASAPPQPVPQAQPQPDAPPSISDADIQRSLQIQRLEAEVSKLWDAYQKRPRRQSFGASTSEYRFARYIEDWRIKVERIGEANYPQAARDQKIYGSLLLTVSIKADGSLDNVELRRSCWTTQRYASCAWARPMQRFRRMSPKIPTSSTSAAPGALPARTAFKPSSAWCRGPHASRVHYNRLHERSIRRYRQSRSPQQVTRDPCGVCTTDVTGY